jgi:hypothetical protein
MQLSQLYENILPDATAMKENFCAAIDPSATVLQCAQRVYTASMPNLLIGLATAQPAYNLIKSTTISNQSEKKAIEELQKGVHFILRAFQLFSLLEHQSPSTDLQTLYTTPNALPKARINLFTIMLDDFLKDTKAPTLAESISSLSKDKLYKVSCILAKLSQNDALVFAKTLASLQKSQLDNFSFLFTKLSQNDALIFAKNLITLPGKRAYRISLILAELSLNEAPLFAKTIVSLQKKQLSNFSLVFTKLAQNKTVIFAKNLVSQDPILSSILVELSLNEALVFAKTIVSLQKTQLDKLSFIFTKLSQNRALLFARDLSPLQYPASTLSFILDNLPANKAFIFIKNLTSQLLTFSFILANLSQDEALLFANRIEHLDYETSMLSFILGVLSQNETVAFVKILTSLENSIFFRLYNILENVYSLLIVRSFAQTLARASTQTVNSIFNLIDRWLPETEAHALIVIIANLREEEVATLICLLTRLSTNTLSVSAMLGSLSEHENLAIDAALFPYFNLMVNIFARFLNNTVQEIETAIMHWLPIGNHNEFPRIQEAAPPAYDALNAISFNDLITNSNIEFRCGIDLEEPTEPVWIPGTPSLYNYKSLAQWYTRKRTNPLTRKPLDFKDVLRVTDCPTPPNTNETSDDL